MATKPYIVIINESTGAFCGVGQWVREYPDALLWSSKRAACKIARELSEHPYQPVSCMVVADYGLAHERTLATFEAGFHVGQTIYCDVHGAEGPYTVREVGRGCNRGRVKVSGVCGWCPAGNFHAEAAC